VLISLTIPFIRVNLFLDEQNKLPVVKMLSALSDTAVYVQNVTAKQGFLSYYNQFMLYAFLAISSVFFIIFIIQFRRIFLLIKANSKRRWNNVCFVFTTSKDAPFSFFKYIFWNENIRIESEEGKSVLQHELSHVEQYHSADKLFLNLVLVACWCNPFFWIIRKELNMLHEFIAEQKAISNGDTNAFAAMLLTTVYPQHSFASTSSFFHSPIKRRLLMLTTSKTTHYSYFRRVAVLPLLASIAILTAFKIEAKHLEKIQKPGKEDRTLIQQQSSGEAKDDLVKEQLLIDNSDTIAAQFPGGNDAWRKYLEKNLNANVAATDKAPAGIYTVKLQFIVTEIGEIRDISAIKVPPACPGCVAEAIKCIAKGPKWEPMTIDGKKATSQVVQFISFAVNE